MKLGTCLRTPLNEGLGSQQRMKPGERRRQQSPEITVRRAIKILKTLVESLTKYSMKSFAGE